jgi:hypothetical protein
MVAIVTFFFSTTLTIEEGDGNYHRLLLLCNTPPKEGDGNCDVLSLPSSF